MAIKFTVEKENDGRIPFLDILIIREGKRLEVDVYRKPTDKPLCIPFDSHHPITHKSADGRA